MSPTVFVHTNPQQLTGALVSAYSLRRNSRNADKFEVKIINHKDYSFFAAREGQRFLRGGEKRIWRNGDLQSFTPLRFMPPELMGYQGRAVVIDPDIFAVGDIYELLSRDMQGKAVFSRARPGYKGRPNYFASSVMLLDCAKLTHWRCEEQFNELFELKRDYMDWTCLELEPPDSIGRLEEEWNHFDRLDDKTKLLHNTNRRTQPWKTGLPVDFSPSQKGWGAMPKRWIKYAGNLLRGEPSVQGRYKPHPDPNQERYFFGMLRECMDQGVVTEDFLRAEMARNHLRHDAVEMLVRTPALAA